MAIDTNFDRLLGIVKSGSTFESLRAADELAKMARQQRRAADVQPPDDRTLSEVLEEALLVRPEPAKSAAAKAATAK